jgi:hypothetical protein
MSPFWADFWCFLAIWGHFEGIFGRFSDREAPRNRPARLLLSFAPSAARTTRPTAKLSLCRSDSWLSFHFRRNRRIKTTSFFGSVRAGLQNRLSSRANKELPHPLSGPIMTPDWTNRRPHKDN